MVARAPEFNVHVIGATDPASVTVDGVGIVGPNFMFRRARGTVGAMSAVQANDGLLFLVAKGYGSTGFSATGRANISMVCCGELDGRGAGHIHKLQDNTEWHYEPNGEDAHHRHRQSRHRNNLTDTHVGCNWRCGPNTVSKRLGEGSGDRERRNASVVRSFNNLPGGTAPTVSKLSGAGTYEVNFGVNVSERFFQATLISSNTSIPGGAADGQILASPRDGNSNAIFVRTNDSTGTNANRSFCLLVY